MKSEIGFVFIVIGGAIFGGGVVALSAIFAGVPSTHTWEFFVITGMCGLGLMVWGSMLRGEDPLLGPEDDT